MMYALKHQPINCPCCQAQLRFGATQYSKSGIEEGVLNYAKTAIICTSCAMPIRVKVENGKAEAVQITETDLMIMRIYNRVMHDQIRDAIQKVKTILTMKNN
ncbi:MAG TPA: hypothetical protein VFV08_05160 [Puia sp.]|nr:hypothetical protein [Puia sp.]